MIIAVQQHVFLHAILQIVSTDCFQAHRMRVEAISMRLKGLEDSSSMISSICPNIMQVQSRKDTAKSAHTSCKRVHVYVESLSTLTFPTRATSRLAFSSTKITPCCFAADCLLSSSSEGGCRPPAILFGQSPAFTPCCRYLYGEGCCIWLQSGSY